MRTQPQGAAVLGASIVARSMRCGSVGVGNAVARGLACSRTMSCMDVSRTRLMGVLATGLS
ncbi:MAG: hypothetical protein ACTHOU_17220 [Aureliella sp.]